VVKRYLASELGPRGIRVHAISPGPVSTRASSGLKEFDQLLEDSRARSPLGELVEIDDVGAGAAFLASPGARRMTGTILHVDAGLNITG
jgi:enoyl-[acyl-carrier protein] reductase I